MLQRILFIVFLCLLSLPLSASEVSALALFARCYAHLTGEPLPLNHTLRATLESANISVAEAACKDILDKGMFNSPSYEINTSDMESQLVLNNFYNLHRSWFATGLFDQTQGIDATKLIGTGDVFDSTEPALAITYSVFKSGAMPGRYEDVVKASNGFLH